MQITKIGDGLAVMLPAELIEQLSLKEGDEVDVRAKEKALEIEAKPCVDDLFARVREMRGKFPADYKFDREDANRRGPDAD